MNSAKATRIASSFANRAPRRRLMSIASGCVTLAFTEKNSASKATTLPRKLPRGDHKTRGATVIEPLPRRDRAEPDYVGIWSRSGLDRYNSRAQLLGFRIKSHQAVRIEELQPGLVGNDREAELSCVRHV